MLKQIKKFWNWLWNSNSVLSWLASFILAFIIVRFIFYPLLALALATSLPLVVVESNSMTHFDNFDSWWQSQEEHYEEFGITGNAIVGWPFKAGLLQGDIIMIQGRNFNDIKIGDVIVFTPETQNKAIIHRVVDVHEDYLETKGDANVGQIGLEKEIKPEQIEGVAIVRMPYIGWVKLFFVEALRSLI